VHFKTLNKSTTDYLYLIIVIVRISLERVTGMSPCLLEYCRMLYPLLCFCITFYVICLLTPIATGSSNSVSWIKYNDQVHNSYKENETSVLWSNQMKITTDVI
jgi:hypothetical protein